MAGGQEGIELDYDNNGQSHYNYAWIEYYPYNHVQVSLNFNYGDQIFASCWASDSNGFRNPNGGYGAYYMGPHPSTA